MHIMHIRNKTNPAPDRTAVYYIHQVSQEKTLDIVKQVINDADTLDDIHYFSAWGQLVTPVTTYSPCAHYLAPLDRQFKRAVVLKNAIPLPPSRSLSVVLGTMLRDMGEGSEIYIQSDRSDKISSLWVMPEDLRRDLPSLKIGEPDGKSGWIRLGWTAALASELASLQSIYPLISRHLPEFFETLALAGHPCADTLTNHPDSAENAFCYSMHWALHTMTVLEKLLPPPRPHMSGMDVGGSYGFLVCELASRGYTVTNVELIDWRIERVLPWLAARCGVADKTRGIVSRMEHLTGEDESHDFILFMGSLLCIDRKDVPAVLDKTKQLLKPGGVMVLRENLLIEATKSGPGIHETRFSPTELNDFLQHHIGTPQFYCHLGLTRTLHEVLSLWTIFAVVQNRVTKMTRAKPLQKFREMISRGFGK
jgi:2-polyprenyl-3-methyl-5-hydroxy-6-metoxy-1,4-benzoquinol methylase